MTNTYNTYLFSKDIIGLDISKGAYKILQYILGLLHKHKRAFARQETMALGTGFELTRIKECIKELKEKGIIRVDYRTLQDSKRFTSNEYFINIDLSLQLIEGDMRLLRLLNGTQLKVYQYIKYRIGLNNSCYVPIEELAIDCGITINTAYRVRKFLVENEYITCENGLYINERINRNEYTLRELDDKFDEYEDVDVADVVDGTESSFVEVEDALENFGTDNKVVTVNAFSEALQAVKKGLKTVIGTILSKNKKPFCRALKLSK